MFIIRAPQYLAAVDFTLHYRRDGGRVGVSCSFLPMLHISWFRVHFLYIYLYTTLC